MNVKLGSIAKIVEVILSLSSMRGHYGICVNIKLNLAIFLMD